MSPQLKYALLALIAMVAFAGAAYVGEALDGRASVVRELNGPSTPVWLLSWAAVLSSAACVASLAWAVMVA